MTTDGPPTPCKAAPHFIGQCDDFDAEPRWCCPLPAAAAERVAADLAAVRADYRERPHPEGGYIIRLAYFTDFNRLEIALMPKVGFTDHTGLDFAHGVAADPEGLAALAPFIEAERARVLGLIAAALDVDPSAVIVPPIDPAFTLDELGAPLRTVLNTEEQQRLEGAGINLDVYAVRTDQRRPYEEERGRLYTVLGIDTTSPEARAIIAEPGSPAAPLDLSGGDPNPETNPYTSLFREDPEQ